jgi:PD-(D/E)XK nuclease superfamily
MIFTTERTENSEMKNLNAEELNKITKTIIGTAIEVHRALGPGWFQSTYVACLANVKLLKYGVKRLIN